MSSRSFRATSLTPPSVMEWAQLEELTLIDALLVDGRSSWTVEPVHDGEEFGWQATRTAAGATQSIWLATTLQSQTLPRSLLWNIEVTEEARPSRAHGLIVNSIFAGAVCIAMLGACIFGVRGGHGMHGAALAMRWFWSFLIGMLVMAVLVIFAAPLLVRKLSPDTRPPRRASSEFRSLVEAIRAALAASEQFKDVQVRGD